MWQWGLLVLRLLTAVEFTQLGVRGYFTADEYWQSLEVAHRMVWGYGHLTWEWQESALRSVCHPALYAVLYKGLSLLGWDSGWAVAYSPRLLGAVLLWISDLSLHSVARTLGGPVLARRALTLYVGSWFVLYAGSRSYSNCVEMVLNVVALHCWVQGHFLRWNLAVAVGCLMRPTAALTWLPCYCSLLGRPRRLLTVGLLA